jgi:hypothetical protein
MRPPVAENDILVVLARGMLIESGAEATGHGMRGVVFRVRVADKAVEWQIFEGPVAKRCGTLGGVALSFLAVI